MKNFFIITNLLIVLNLNAQAWTNLNFSESQQYIENNPLKGFADLYGPTNTFPRSINGKLFGLNEVMNGLNNFNWAVIDNFIAQNKSEGNFSYIQVNIDPGPNGDNVPQSYMPAFLNGQYNFITVNGPVADICPDWNDPQIIEAMLNFIAAFGAKYNNKPEVFMVHLGLYGIYGEWQIGDAANIAPDYEMTQANKTLIANAYKAAFSNTYLLARYPENMPNAEDFGYSDGLFFTQSISNNTFFNHFYFGNTLNLYNANQNWKNQIIGGEIDPCVQPSIWQNWPNASSINCNPTNPSGQNADVQDVQQTLTALHPTFLFSHHIFTALNQTTNPQEWNNAILAQKKLGYTFYLNEYRLSASNGFPSIEANIQNTGIAPMYANWDVEVGIINTNTNQFQSLGTKKWNLNIIQPSVQDNYRSFTSQISLADGNYIFLLRIVNPLEAFSPNADPVRFANDTQDANRMGWLTLGQATITAGITGTPSVRVSGITVGPTSANLVVGNTLQLTAVISPTNATNQDITWVSNKPGTASVSSSGLVTAGANYGPVAISAYTQDGGFLGESQITVQPISIVIPALIEAENYVRMNGIIPGFGKLGFIDNRDWMDYNITVNAATNYFIDLYASCPNCNDDLNQVQNVGYINIKDQNGVILDVVRLLNTNSFDNFETATSASILLPIGTYNIRFEAEKGGFDIDKVAFRLDGTLGTQIPNALTFCQGAKVSDAVGTTSLKFYTALTGGNLLLNTATLTNRTVYATQTLNGIESSPRIPVVITINPLPTEVLGAITSTIPTTTTTTGFVAATTAVGQYVKTTTPISYRIPAFTSAGLSYLWTVPTGVTIVGSADTNVLTVHYNNVAEGVDTIGAIKVQAVNTTSGCSGTAKSITVSKVLPTAPSSIKMTNAALPLPLSGVPAAIRTFAPYMGTTTELTLTARPSLTATSYVWELPTGVNITNGSATTIGGVTESTLNVITVNFSGVTNMNTVTSTLALVPTNVIRISAKAKNGVGVSVTSNSLLVDPTTTSTARLVTLKATNPVAPSSLKMFNTSSAIPTTGLTDISKFIGTDTELTLTAAVSKLASSYSWEIPSSVTIVAGSNLASNSIKVTFKNVPAGTSSLYLGVKAINGMGSSVTNNSALTTPATLSTARLLKVIAIVPSIVGTVTGSLAICSTTATDVVYSIATTATRANTYNITVPVGCTINGGATNVTTITATAGATFTVNYPALFTANATTAIKKIFIQSENGFGVSITNKTLSLTNVGAVCTPKLANTSTTPFEVKAYPNPSSSEFTIETSAKGALNVKVYDMQGRLVEETDTNKVGARLSAGTYNVIVNQGVNTKSVRVIKQ